MTPITQEVPLATDNPVSIYHDDLLRKEAGGTTYWQLPVFVTSKSLASKCPYPFLTETINVNVSKSSSGKVTANKATLGRVQMTTGMENPNITAAVKCIGDNDWKRAHSRAENFLKGLHTQG